MLNYELISDENKRAGVYLMELIRAALTGEKAAQKPESVSWEAVYVIAKHHSVEAVSAYGVETLAKNVEKSSEDESYILLLPDKSLWKEWQTRKNQTMFKGLHFDIERQQILAEMEAQGLSYLPLKGVLIATYYPNPGMRSMADNDILYGFVEKAEQGYRISGKNASEQSESVERAQKIMVDIMKKRSYDVENLAGNHDTYHKLPFYNFEMHRQLMSSQSAQYNYYANPWLRAVKDEDGSFGYHFSDEDEYLYFLAHAYKHFDGGGCGVRLLNDTYVFLKRKGTSMNRDYLEKELEKLGLSVFEKDITGLVKAIFVENRQLSEKEQELLYFLLGCGTYGRSDVRVMKSIDKIAEEGKHSPLKAKLLYVKSRMFLDEAMIKEYFPFFYKKPYLMPVLLIYRVGKGLIIHPKMLYSEWKNIWKKRKNS